MCGISGIYLAKKDSQIVSNIKNSITNLKHRGPDDNGVFIDFSDRLALGHTRLSIIDLSSAGHQPLLNKNSDKALSFNGEIYNFKDLKRNYLNNLPIIWKGSSDTEVLLNFLSLYNYSKDNFSDLLKKLNGIFAFAYWDKKNSELIIARDAFGVKPLYYFHSRKGFYFASEIKSLISMIFDEDKNFLKDTKDKFNLLDIDSINRYLTFLWCPGNGTPFSFIKKVRPGEFIKVNKNNQLSFNKWYSSIYKLNKINNLSLSKNIIQTSKLLRQAVHRQMISDAPVGAFLSGGLDSSSIVNFAREIDKDIKCFTIDTSKYKDNEGIIGDLEYAQKVSQHLNVSLEIVPVDHNQLAKSLEEMIYQLDEPLADPAALNVLWISQIASNLGIKVLLSGAGGDDLFSGYRRHFALNLEYMWEWLPKKIRYKFEKLSSKLPNTSPFLRRFNKAFSAASLSKDERLLNYFRWIKRADLQNLYSDDLRNFVSIEEADKPIKNFLYELSSEMKNLEKMLRIEQRFFLTDHNLLYTDKMSMAEGVETRVPFLDNDLVEFARSIPIKWKQNGRISKWILKKSMESYLPYEVIYRSKSGFGAPMRYLFMNELRDWVFKILSKDRLKDRGLFNPEAVHSLIKRNLLGEIDASYTILSLICIELWCDSYLSFNKVN